ncbi:S-phase kinase-associated protein 1 [Geodia barretti]|uniref:S-phase kinase-associated protein 1 n=1 Tax=Geodia barretti TaxID=519541 RepID=A0AA35XLZ9_GEOBA|nr:S-phase kinase-associated protein 1 [Geodia barretti]
MMATEHEEATTTMIRLQSSDGKTFAVPVEVVRVSRTIDTMLKELGAEPEDVIPLPNVHSRILNKILGWAEYYVSSNPPEPAQQSELPPTPPPAAPSTSPSLPPPQPRPQPRVPQRSRAQLLPPPSHTLTQWEREFVAKNREDVYDLLLAANYLDIKGLLDILCKAVADMIQGKDPQQIRRAFNASEPSTITTYPPPIPFDGTPLPSSPDSLPTHPHT